MKIAINAQPIDFQMEQEQNIGEILGSLEEECEKAGMTVTALKCDGQNIPAEGLDDLFARSPDSVKILELTTMSGNDVCSMMRELGKRFSDSIPLLQNIPVLLQTGKDLQVMETINSSSSDLHSLYQLLPLLSITELPAQGPEIDGTPLSDYPSVLSPILKELLDALEKKDTILVGDLSEYELAPRIERLGAVLSAI